MCAYVRACVRACVLVYVQLKFYRIMSIHVAYVFEAICVS